MNLSITTKTNDNRVLNEILKQINQSKYFKSLGSTLDLKSKNLIEEFKSLKISIYEDYKLFIDEILNKNCLNVFSMGIPSCIFKTGGSSGAPKLLPQYKPSFKQWPNSTPTQEVIDYLVKNKGLKKDKKLTGVTLILRKEYLDEIPIGIGSSFKPHDSTSIVPECVALIEDYKSFLYVNLLFAIKHQELAYLCSTYLHIIKDFLLLLKLEWANLISDFKHGSICLKYKRFIQPSILKCIEFQMFTELDRYNQLISLDLEHAFLGSLIWPNLTLVQANCSSSFYNCISYVRNFFENVHITDLYFSSSEALIGTSTGEPNEFLLRNDLHYFEFETLDKNNVLSIDQTEINTPYLLIITTVNGLIRYRMDDVIEIIKFNHWPIIKIINKVGWKIRISSENFEPEFFINCLNSVFKIPILASVFIDISTVPNRYSVFIEPSSKLDFSLEKLEFQLQELLCLNIQYQIGCDTNKINSPPKLLLVKSYTFDKLMIKFSKDSNFSQFKLPIFLTDDLMIKFLKNCIC